MFYNLKFTVEIDDLSTVVTKGLVINLDLFQRSINVWKLDVL